MKTPHIRRRAVVISASLILVVATVGYALRPEVIDVDTYVVTAGPMRVTVDEDGRTRVRNRFVIAAPVAGRLERVQLREGDKVTRGQIVAWIAPLPLDSAERRTASARHEAAQAIATESSARVKQARVALDLAKSVEARRKALFDAGAISLEQYEQSAADLRVKAEELSAALSRARSSNAEVSAVRVALFPTEGRNAKLVPISSPVSGRVLRIPEVSERVVAASSPIIELGDAAALEVVSDVLSSDAVRIRPGNTVEIAEWGGDRPLTGRVRSIEPSAFTRISALGVEEQRVNVLVDILDPPPTIGDGFMVEMRAVIWESPKVLSVPSSAVFQRSGNWEVFTVENGRARRRRVEVGHRSAATVEILSGVSAGERVILFPSDQIDEGVRVST